MRRTVYLPNQRRMLLVGVPLLVGVMVVLALALSRAGGLPWQPSLARQLSSAAAQRPVSRTDRVIWDAQEVLRANPDSVDSYALLASAYVQKARETGDPSYYGKAQAAVDQALRRDPRWRQLSAALYGGSKRKSGESILKAQLKKGVKHGSAIGYGGHFRAVQGFRFYGAKGLEAAKAA